MVDAFDQATVREMHTGMYYLTEASQVDLVV